jgi:hypothetical protein
MQSSCGSKLFWYAGITVESQSFQCECLGKLTQAGPILKAQKHFVSPKLDRTLFGALSSNVVARKATCDLVRVVIVPLV